MEPEIGFEPMTCALRKRCSTTELLRQNLCLEALIHKKPLTKRSGRDNSNLESKQPMEKPKCP